MTSAPIQGSRLPYTIAAATLVVGATLGPIAGLPIWMTVIFGLGAIIAGAAVVQAPARNERRARDMLVRRLGLNPELPLEDAAERAAARVETADLALERERQRSWYGRPEAATLVEALSEATMLVGGDGMVRLANDRCRRLLGLDQTPVGRHVEELITKAELLEEIASARRGVGGRSKIRLPRAEGLLICETTTTPIAGGRTPADVLISIRDITDLAGAMQLKTDFVANASHELRTPISAIRAAADTLHAAGADEAMRERLLGMIQTHVTQLDELVRDLLDLSKLESAEAPVSIKPLAMSEIAADLASTYDEACGERGVSLVFDLDPRLERMRTDRRLLMLIVKNLVENAAKFARDGTEVRVEATASPSDEGSLDGVELRVIDSGQGIPLSQQQRIFERFYQVDAARTGGGPRGTGLGLAIVKHAAKLLEGEIEVESVWGQGTTMIARLPSCVERG